MADNELNLNDPSKTASRDPARTAEARQADREAPLHEEEKKSKAAAGAATGLGGAVAAGGIGMVTGGPIGAIIGAAAGALGGWWVGSASVVAAEYDEADDEYYRRHYESQPVERDGTFEVRQPAYRYGHVARRNPDYAGRSFDDVEPELRRGWTTELTDRYGAWESVRPHVRVGYDRPVRETVSERTVVKDDERAAGRAASARDGLRSDTTTGY